jgi:hypothetical protein
LKSFPLVPTRYFFLIVKVHYAVILRIDGVRESISRRSIVSKLL